MSEVIRHGRTTHPSLGKCVEVSFRTWEGTRGKEVWTRAVFPIDQASRQLHRRCPTGYDDAGDRIACIAPSCSFYGSLVKFGGFRWA